MKRFFKDFIIYGFSSVFSKIISIFLMPIFTSILTRDEYGSMALIMSCYGILDLVSNLNIHSGVARDYYEKDIDRKQLVSTGLFSEIMLSLVIMVFMFLTRDFWAYSVLSLKESYMPHFCIMLLSVPLGGMKLYFSILTRFKRKPVLFTVGSIITVIVQLSFNILGVVYLRWGVITLFISTILSDIVGILFFGYINKDLVANTYKLQYIKRILQFSLPTLPAICAGWIDSSVGQIFIGKYISTEDLGVYSISLTFASAITLLSTAFQNVWSPFLYENYQKEGFKNEVNRLFVTFVSILILVSITISLLGHEIILLFTTPEYIDAVKYMTILFIPLSYYMMFPIASSGVSISRKTKNIGVSYILGSVMNLLFLIISLQFIGIVAVPICLGISRVTTYTYLYHCSKKEINYELPNYLLLLLILAMVACYLINYYYFSLPIRISILIILSSFIIWRLNKFANLYGLVMQFVNKKK